MKANLTISTNDLKTLFLHTQGAYNGLSFYDWCKECKKSYLSYFNNKPLYNNKKYTYSQFVNAQIKAITQPF